MSMRLNHGEIIERAKRLPAFPRVVKDILETLDDENATIGSLAHHVERDPVITARLLALANSAAYARGGRALKDVATAASLMGVAKVRELVLSISVAKFAQDSRVSPYYWEHSVAVGVCAQEFARYGGVSADYALVAGLLHDIGQLWMAKFFPLEFQQVRMAVSAGTLKITEAEQRLFGFDHCDIGFTLADHWGLPQAIAEAIYRHHDPDPGLAEPLVAVIHVAEVVANALELTRRDENQVTSLSAAACAALGIDWSEGMGPLFGRIEARAEYACAVFR